MLLTYLCLFVIVAAILLPYIFISIRMELKKILKNVTCPQCGRNFVADKYVHWVDYIGDECVSGCILVCNDCRIKYYVKENYEIYCSCPDYACPNCFAKEEDLEIISFTQSYIYFEEHGSYCNQFDILAKCTNCNTILKKSRTVDGNFLMNKLKNKCNEKWLIDIEQEDVNTNDLFPLIKGDEMDKYIDKFKFDIRVLERLFDYYK